MQLHCIYIIVENLIFLNVFITMKLFMCTLKLVFNIGKKLIILIWTYSLDLLFVEINSGYFMEKI